MVAIYVRWIDSGRMTLTDVLSHWRSQVADKLGLTVDG